MIAKLCEICWKLLVRKYGERGKKRRNWLRVGGSLRSEFVRVMGDE